MSSWMEVWDSSRILRMVVRQASPTVKPVEARLTLSCRCFYVIFFGPKGRFVMNKYLYYWTWNLVIKLLLYVWFEHPGHMYGSFVPSFSEWGMTKTRCDRRVLSTCQGFRQRNLLPFKVALLSLLIRWLDDAAHPNRPHQKKRNDPLLWIIQIRWQMRSRQMFLSF
jgi:hypothetical protein